MKTSIKTLKLSVFLSFICITSCAQAEIGPERAVFPSHPRILLTEGEETAIKTTIAADTRWSNIHYFILAESDKLIGKEPVERVLIGRRLLDKSREALRRIFYLSYSYRMTSDKKYSDRAKEELLAISAFSDWNPSHFLDVAEMTMAASIGYDWLYRELDQETLKKVKEAIINKGLKPSLESKNNSWLKAYHNWNQVCNAGMTFGALAVYEDETELAKSIIDRAVSSIKLPMEDYLPDGAYAEGYSYWGYGTNFNVMFLSAMEKAFGKDYGLTINEGVLKTAQYLENMTGPAGTPFNYSDAGSGANIHPAMFWLANRVNDPSLLWSEKYLLMNKPASNDRLLPAVMAWSAGITMNRITPPAKTIWVGQGKNPVALMRSSWTDPDAVYLAMKAGSPSVNHGHMDVGSFVMEANGERWAMDFGMQEYNSLEQAGVNLWSMVQNSQRWEVFRYNNYVHNTLTINNELQKVAGYASIKSHSEDQSLMNAITDLTTLYDGLVRKAERGVAIAEKKYVIIRDEIETLSSETTIRWTMLTSADVSITGSNSAVLTKSGKKLTISVKEPASAVFKTWSTEPTHDYDAKNPGTIMVGFEVKFPGNTKAVLNVLLMPEGAVENTSYTGKSLDKWPQNSGGK